MRIAQLALALLLVAPSLARAQGRPGPSPRVSEAVEHWIKIANPKGRPAAAVLTRGARRAIWRSAKDGSLTVPQVRPAIEAALSTAATRAGTYAFRITASDMKIGLAQARQP